MKALKRAKDKSPSATADSQSFFRVKDKKKKIFDTN
jgi:hypothetical protein